jgi:hypothetical protein
VNPSDFPGAGTGRADFPQVSLVRLPLQLGAVIDRERTGDATSLIVASAISQAVRSVLGRPGFSCSGRSRPGDAFTLWPELIWCLRL